MLLTSANEFKNAAESFYLELVTLGNLESEQPLY